MDAYEVSAEVAIRAECWNEFERKRHVVFDQLTYLRTSVYLLKEIVNFPIDEFVAFGDQIFLRVVTRSLYDTAVLTIARITTDQSSDVLTLPAFRNQVADLLVPEAIESFRRRLKETKFDAATCELAERVREFRDHRLAHLSVRQVPPRISFDELEQLVQSVERLYEPLLFRAVAWFLPIEYVAAVRSANPPRPIDIEQVLDGFAQRSYTVNMPERNPAAWPHHRESMPAEKLAAIYRWRLRLGLSEA